MEMSGHETDMKLMEAQGIGSGVRPCGKLYNNARIDRPLSSCAHVLAGRLGLLEKQS